MSSTQDMAPPSPASSDCSFSSLFGEEPDFQQRPKLTLPASRPPSPPASYPPSSLEQDPWMPQGIMHSDPVDLTNEQWAERLSPLRVWCHQVEVEPVMSVDPALLSLSSPVKKSFLSTEENSAISMPAGQPASAPELSFAQGSSRQSFSGPDSQGSLQPRQAPQGESVLSALPSEPPTSRSSTSPKKKGSNRAPRPRKSRQHLGRDACTQCKESKVKCVRLEGAGPGQPCIQCAKRDRACQMGKDNRTNRDVRQDLLVLVARFKEAVTDLTSLTLYFKQGLVGDTTRARSHAELLDTHTPRQLLAVLEGTSEWKRLPPPCFPGFCDQAVAGAQEGTKLARTRTAMEQFSAQAIEHLENMQVLLDLTAGRMLLPDHVDKARVFAATSANVSANGAVPEGLLQLLAGLGVGVHLLSLRSLEVLEVNYAGHFRVHAGKQSPQPELPAPAPARASAPAPLSVVSQDTVLVRPGPATELARQQVEPPMGLYAPAFPAYPPGYGFAPAPALAHGFQGFMSAPRWDMGHMAHAISHAGSWAPVNFINPPSPNSLISSRSGMVASSRYPRPPTFINRR